MNISMKHHAPAARWAAALTAAFAMSQADAATAPGAVEGARQGAAADYGLQGKAASGNQHYLADDAALLEGPQHLWGVG